MRMVATTVAALAASIAVFGAVAVAEIPAASEERTKAPEGAQTYFIFPSDGAEVSSPVRIKFGLRGMGVAPAGIERDGTGHHHLLVNQKLADYNEPIPADDTHLHFGGGQTETKLDLPKGQHTLQLVLGDESHIPHTPPIESDVITITVK